MVNQSWHSHLAALTSCPDKLRSKMTIAKTREPQAVLIACSILWRIRRCRSKQSFPWWKAWRSRAAPLCQPGSTHPYSPRTRPQSPLVSSVARSQPHDHRNQPNHETDRKGGLEVLVDRVDRSLLEMQREADPLLASQPRQERERGDVR